MNSLFDFLWEKFEGIVVNFVFFKDSFYLEVLLFIFLFLGRDIVGYERLGKGFGICRKFV